MDNNEKSLQKIKKMSCELIRMMEKYRYSLRIYIRYLVLNILGIIFMLVLIFFAAINSHYVSSDLGMKAINFFILFDAIIVCLKNKNKHMLRDLYFSSLDLVEKLGTLIEWDRNRRKFGKLPPKKAIEAINLVFSVTQHKLSPYRTGIKISDIISIINMCTIVTLAAMIAFSLFN